MKAKEPIGYMERLSLDVSEIQQGTDSSNGASLARYNGFDFSRCGAGGQIKSDYRVYDRN